MLLVPSSPPARRRAVPSVLFALGEGAFRTSSAVLFVVLVTGSMVGWVTIAAVVLVAVAATHPAARAAEPALAGAVSGARENHIVGSTGS